MNTNNCLTFHQFFCVLNGRLTKADSARFEQHLKICRRCQEELHFVRKIQQVISAQHDDFTPIIRPLPLPDHISSNVQEQYFQGTLTESQRDQVHSHLTGCNDCLQEFGRIARYDLPELSAEQQAVLSAIKTADPLDPVPAYRPNVAAGRPTLKAHLRQVIAGSNRLWRRLSWQRKGALAAVGLVVLIFVSFPALSAYVTFQNARTSFDKAVTGEKIYDDELRPSGAGEFAFGIPRGVEDDKPENRLRSAAVLKALELKPESVEFNHKLGTIYFFEGKMELAEQYYRRALAIDAKNARIHNDLSLIYFDKKAFSTALEHLQKALTLDPELLEAHYNRAMVLEFLNEKENAIAAWKRYIDLENKNSDWRRAAQLRLKELSE